MIFELPYSKSPFPISYNLLETQIFKIILLLWADVLHQLLHCIILPGLQSRHAIGKCVVAKTSLAKQLKQWHLFGFSTLFVFKAFLHCAFSKLFKQWHELQISTFLHSSASSSFQFAILPSLGQDIAFSPILSLSHPTLPLISHQTFTFSFSSLLIFTFPRTRYILFTLLSHPTLLLISF